MEAAKQLAVFVTQRSFEQQSAPHTVISSACDRAKVVMTVSSPGSAAKVQWDVAAEGSAFCMCAAAAPNLDS